MTLKIDFDNANRKKILQHLNWLVEIGLIKSFKEETKENTPNKTTEEFINEMVSKGEAEIANEKVYAQTEVEQKIKEWQANKK